MRSKAANVPVAHFPVATRTDHRPQGFIHIDTLRAQPQRTARRGFLVDAPRVPRAALKVWARVQRARRRGCFAAACSCVVCARVVCVRACSRTMEVAPAQMPLWRPHSAARHNRLGRRRASGRAAPRRLSACPIRSRTAARRTCHSIQGLTAKMTACRVFVTHWSDGGVCCAHELGTGGLWCTGPCGTRPRRP
jgi:hypothetical protein